MDAIATLALALGASWASGLNLYAAILALGFMHNAERIELPPELQLLGDPLVLIAAGFMYVVEFIADKIPGVDSGWDVLHTFIRIPAGAILAAQSLGSVDPALALAAGLVGGTVAGTSHAMKASGRMLINTSPEPVSNWAASIGEDVAVFSGLWVAANHPLAFLLLLAGFLVLAIWLLPRLLRLLGRIASRILAFVRGRPRTEQPEPAPASARPPAPAPAAREARPAAVGPLATPRFAGRRGYRGGAGH